MEYAATSDAEVKNGDVVLMVRSGATGFVFDVDAAMWMARSECDAWEILQGLYTPVLHRGDTVSLALRLEAIQDLPAPEVKERTKTPKDPVVALAMRLLKPEGNKARRPKRIKRVKHDADHVAPGPDAGPVVDAVEGKKAPTPPASDTDASDDSDSGSDSGSDPEHVAAKLEEDWKAAIAVAAGAEPPPPLPPPDAPPPEALPAKRPDGQVYDPAGRHLGRITYLERGASIALCVYCRKHQCAKTVSSKRGPTEHGALQWLAHGWGETCGSKQEHLAAFERLVLAGP